jgi:4-hydroxy-3-polyprenylbenzoate decarboxylase
LNSNHTKITKTKIVVAITGASGAIYAKQLLDFLQRTQERFERVEVVFSENGRLIWDQEVQLNPKIYPFRIYNHKDLSAPFISGSSGYQTMIIIPCSMGRLARIGSGWADDIISRGADVMLKEQRQLILVPREMPLNLIHIKNLERIILAGGIIIPASPSFYHHPKTIEELVNSVVVKVLNQIGIKDIKIK